NDSERDFVGRLILVEAVAAEHLAVPCEDMRGVLDADSLQHSVRGIGNESLDRTDQPFGGVEHMRERVLDRTAAGTAVGVVGVAVRRGDSMGESRIDWIYHRRV